MVIGGLIISRDKKQTILRDIVEIFHRHSFQYELKWVRTSPRFFDLYKDILDYFWASDFMSFRCIVVDKSKVDYPQYHDDDPELAFFKFYYLMLRRKLLDYNRYYIFLDKKPTRDKNRARALHAFLESYILLHRRNCVIEHLQAYHSHENIFLQISDFLTGLVAHAVNENVQGTTKDRIIRYLQTRIPQEKFLNGTPLSEEKFNIFVWEGRNA